MQRWLYFVKYLRLFGWEPIVYTVQNGEYPYLDEGLKQHIPEGIQVIKRPILEPYGFYRKLTGQNQKVNPTIFAEKNPGLLKRIFVWIRGNIFIPDPRVLWVAPSVNFLSDYLSMNPVDAIVSTGPPHSMHLIARNLRRKLKIPWLADFRDPWTQIYFFNQLQMSWLAKKIHLKLEQSVLKEADSIVTVSKNCADGLNKISGRTIQVITNGYEEFELNKIQASDDHIRMLYAGVLSLDRNPSLFWKILIKFLDSRPELKQRFELWLIGNIDQTIIDQLKNTTLNTSLHVLASIPQMELQKYLLSADLFLLIGVPGNPGVITGKLFEYLYLKKPIYSISPSNSDLEEIVNSTCSGFNADFEDASGMYNNLKLIFDLQQKGTFQSQVLHVEKYSRKNLTKDIAALLNGIVGNKLDG